MSIDRKNHIPFVTPVTSCAIVADPIRVEALERAMKSPEWQAYIRQVEADFLFGRPEDHAFRDLLLRADKGSSVNDPDNVITVEKLRAASRLMPKRVSFYNPYPKVIDYIGLLDRDTYYGLWGRWRKRQAEECGIEMRRRHAFYMKHGYCPKTVDEKIAAWLHTKPWRKLVPWLEKGRLFASVAAFIGFVLGRKT